MDYVSTITPPVVPHNNLNLDFQNLNLTSNASAELSQKAIKELLEWYRNRGIHPGINFTASDIKCAYCDGLLWNSFTDYRALHGYLTLVVSPFV